MHKGYKKKNEKQNHERKKKNCERKKKNCERKKKELQKKKKSLFTQKGYNKFISVLRERIDNILLTLL
jgi:hypothetical protein